MYILHAIPILFLVAMGVGALWAIRADRRCWNKGVCPTCGRPWRNFDTDSQGGLGYTCGNGHYLWIGWPHVTRER